MTTRLAASLTTFFVGLLLGILFGVLYTHPGLFS